MATMTIRSDRTPSRLGLQSMSLRLAARVGGVALTVLASGAAFHAQSLSYSRGQNVSPGFEGWELNSDGSASMVFGYMNNNWDEEIDVPVGPDNGFAPMGPDVGQPTHFLPRRNRFVFKVKVPKDFGNKELVWTLKTNGVTEKAYGSLKQDYFIDNVVIASETGALGAGSSNPTMRANEAPLVIVEGPKARQVRVGEPLELSATVKDDGVPKAPGQGLPMPNPANLARRAMQPPIRLTVGKSLGLHLSWFVYRGAGPVKFDPPQVKVWEDTRAGANSPWAPMWFAGPLPPENRWKARAIFSEPGTYVLRARADDGALLGDEELTVTVTR